MFVGPKNRNNSPQGALQNGICIFYKNEKGQKDSFALYFVILRRISSLNREIAPCFRLDCKANLENRAGNDKKIRAGYSYKGPILGLILA